MTNGPAEREDKRITLHLVEIRPGISTEDLAAALERLMPRHPPERIRRALKHLPIVLTRSATPEQARKIKGLLEARGGVIKAAYTSAAQSGAAGTGSDPCDQDRTPKTAGGPAESPPDTPEKMAPEPGAERRAKPRIHPGIQLHPMGIGEILDRSFRLLRQHLWLFFFILLIPQGAFFLANKTMQILFAGGAALRPTVSTGIGMGISILLSAIAFILLQFWAPGALIHAVSETYLGHSTSLGTAYGAIRRRLGGLVGTMILMLLLVGAAPALSGILAAIIIPSFARAGVSRVIIGLVAAVLIILAVLLSIRLFLNWLLVDKVVVLEKIKGKKALNRSRELMNARMEPGFWKSTKMKAGLILLLGFLIGIAIHASLQFPMLIFQLLMPGNLVVMTLQQLLNMAATSLVTAYTAIAMILYYYDIRLRREGFDLKMMAEHL